MAQKLALILGIENYPDDSGQPRVDYALNDARAIADYALQAGFTMIGGEPLLDEAVNYPAVIEHLDTLFNSAGKDDFVLLYFAGHGHFTNDGGYLIPHSYQEKYAVNESCCISFDSIDKRFTRNKTDRFIFFLDTCHSGYAGKHIGLREAKSRDVKMSTAAGEKVKE